MEIIKKKNKKKLNIQKTKKKKLNIIYFLFSWAPKSLQTVTAAMKWKDTCSLEEKLWQI